MNNLCSMCLIVPLILVVAFVLRSSELRAARARRHALARWKAPRRRGRYPREEP